MLPLLFHFLASLPIMLLFWLKPLLNLFQILNKAPPYMELPCISCFWPRTLFFFVNDILHAVFRVWTDFIEFNLWKYVSILQELMTMYRAFLSTLRQCRWALFNMFLSPVLGYIKITAQVTLYHSVISHKLERNIWIIHGTSGDDLWNIWLSS